MTRTLSASLNTSSFKLHSQELGLAEVDADEEQEELMDLMGPALPCPGGCGQQPVDCVCPPGRPVDQEPDVDDEDWVPGMGLGANADGPEGPPPCPLVQRAIRLGVLGLAARFRHKQRALPAACVDVIAPGSEKGRRAWLMYAGQTGRGVMRGAGLWRRLRCSVPRLVLTGWTGAALWSTGATGRMRRRGNRGRLCRGARRIGSLSITRAEP